MWYSVKANKKKMNEEFEKYLSIKSNRVNIGKK